MTEAEKLVISTQQRWTLHHKHRRKRDKIPRKQPAKSIIINIFTIHLSLILQYIPQVLWGTVGQGWSRQLVDELGGASCGHVTCGRSLLPQCPQLGEQKEGVSCEDGSGHYSHPKEAWTLAARERERERVWVHVGGIGQEWKFSLLAKIGLCVTKFSTAKSNIDYFCWLIFTLTLMSSSEVLCILWDSFSVRRERDSRARSWRRRRTGWEGVEFVVQGAGSLSWGVPKITGGKEPRMLENLVTISVTSPPKCKRNYSK